MTVSGSAAGAARDQAGRLGRIAAEAGREVADATREQAGEVLSDATGRARGLAIQARDEAVRELDDQRGRLVEGIRSVGDELQTMADRADGGGMAADIARAAGDRALELAAYLDRRGTAEMVDDLREFARRRPGAFLAGALTAGVVIGRLARGAMSSAQPEPRSLARPEPESGFEREPGHEGARGFEGAPGPEIESGRETATGRPAGRPAGPPPATPGGIAPGAPRPERPRVPHGVGTPAPPDGGRAPGPGSRGEGGPR